MTAAQIVPAIVVPLVAWRVYVRVRRNIGRQPYQPRRMVARIVIISLISVLIGWASLSHLESFAALVGGIVLALPLAWFGVKLTKFDFTPEAKSYTPNTAIGIALSVLLVGRLAYRFVALASMGETQSGPPPGLFQSPVTLLVFGVTAGYYIGYSVGVLVRAKQLAAGK